MTEQTALPSRTWPRALRLGLFVMMVLVFAGMGSWWLAASHAPDGVEYYTEAWEHAQSMSMLPGRRQGGMEPRVPPPQPDDAVAWTPTSLPADVDGGVDPEGPVAGLTQPITVWWYRVRYVVPAGVEGPLAIYIPRVVGVGVQVVSYEDGHWLVHWDGAEQRLDQWNRPVLVQLGEAGPAGRVVNIAVRLTRETLLPHSITPIQVGPLSALEQSFQVRNLFQQIMPQVSSLTFASLGLLSLIYWFRRRSDHIYLLFALTAVAWILSNLHYYMATPKGATENGWFWWMSNASLSWAVVLVYLFAMRFQSVKFKRVEWLLVGCVTVASVLTMPPLWAYGRHATGGFILTDLADVAVPVGTYGLWLIHLINAVVTLVSLGWLSLAAWRDGGQELRIITMSLWALALAGLHDVMLSQGWLPLELVYLLPVGSMVIFMALLHAAQIRYSHAVWQVENANVMLEHRLSEREAQLRANHERLRAFERDQALLLERQRLMRDMHDGLGSTLMSTLVLVEQGRLGSEEVGQLLRECVDDLRLVIDSLEPIDHDLVTLLAALRHRLGQRLEAAGLALEWEVEDVPPLAWLHPPDALQILRVVQEALTNVLKHARATRVHIRVHQDGDHVRVTIEDNGVGFDLAHVTQGRGLRHLSQRATRLGGEVELRSLPGQGTRVCLVLPLVRGNPA